MCTYTDMQYTTYSTDSVCVWLVPVHFRAISKSHVLPELLFATLTEMSQGLSDGKAIPVLDPARILQYAEMGWW